MTGREQLSTFIGPDRGARAAFARKANISQPHLLLYLRGDRDLSIAMAKRISDATDGSVPLRALVKEDVASILPEEKVA